MPRSIARPSSAELERAADALLRAHAQDDPNPPLSRQQLARKSRRELPAGLLPPDREGSSAAHEELLQLERLTPMTPLQRRAFRMWAAGDNVDTIARQLRLHRASAARLVRSALVCAYLFGGPTFRQFSQRAIYRPPRAQDTYRSGARCQVCAAPLWDNYRRATCGNLECRAVMSLRRKLDRRRLYGK